MQNAVKKNIVDGNFWNKETLEIVYHKHLQKDGEEKSVNKLYVKKWLF